MSIRKVFLSTLSSKSILTNLTAMAILGVLNTSFIVSFSSLIFSSICPDYFAAAIALFLLAGGITSILTAVLSSYSGSIAMIQDVPVAITALMAASLAASLGDVNPDILFANIFAAISISTLLTGASFLFLGWFKLGNLVRFIPYPVMGGFLAATGWLLLKGGLNVSIGKEIEIANLYTFFVGSDLWQLSCAILFGIAMFFLTRRYPSSIVVAPAVIVCSIILFLIVTSIYGASNATLLKSGWLLGPLPNDPLWQSATLPSLSQIDWGAVTSQASGISTIVVLSVISFLLNSSGIEFIAGRDLDINRDFKATGLVNLLTGGLGAPASFVLFSETALSSRIGAKGCSVGILFGIFLLMIFFVGGGFLSFFPNFIAGGMPIYLGLSMLLEWLYDKRKTISKNDYLIIIIILLVVEFIGFLEGIGVGIIVSILIFVIRYGSVNIIKKEMNSNSFRSRKDRIITDQKLLDYHAEQLLILKLQGFIFFGTAHSLYEKIKQKIPLKDNPVKFIVIDMLLVQGIDSSAIKSFQKLTQQLADKKIQLAMVGLTDRIKSLFISDGFTEDNYPFLHFFNDLDCAVEWCEDNIIFMESAALQEAIKTGKHTQNDLFENVYDDLMAALDIQVKYEELIAKMQPYLINVEHTVNDVLYSKNDNSKGIYFIVQGQVTLSRQDSEGNMLRVRTLGPWTVTGELSLFLGYHEPFDASVQKAGQIYKLSQESKEHLEKDDFKLAFDLHKLIINMLCEQLMKTSGLISISDS